MMAAVLWYRPGARFSKSGRHDHDVVRIAAIAVAGRRSGQPRLGQVEQRDVFALAEVLRLEELGQANDLGAALGGFGNAIQRFGHVVGRFGPARYLHQGDGELVEHLFLQVCDSIDGDAASYVSTNGFIRLLNRALGYEVCQMWRRECCDPAAERFAALPSQPVSRIGFRAGHGFSRAAETC